MPRKYKPVEPPKRNIAYSIDRRGVNEDVPAWVFIGSDATTINEAFRLIISGGIIAKGFVLYEDHACEIRNKHPYWRLAVELNGYDEHFCSTADVNAIIERMIRKQGHEVTFYPDYTEFINL